VLAASSERPASTTSPCAEPCRQMSQQERRHSVCHHVTTANFITPSVGTGFTRNCVLSYKKDNVSPHIGPSLVSSPKTSCLGSCRRLVDDTKLIAGLSRYITKIPPVSVINDTTTQEADV